TAGYVWRHPSPLPLGAGSIMTRDFLVNAKVPDGHGRYGTRPTLSRARRASERPERRLLPPRQRVAFDVQDHRHDGVVPDRRNQVDHALIAEAAGDRREGGIGDR